MEVTIERIKINLLSIVEKLKEVDWTKLKQEQ